MDSLVLRRVQGITEVMLGQMNGREKTAFEGLFNMEVSKKYGPISVATMIDLAYSCLLYTSTSQI